MATEGLPPDVLLGHTLDLGTLGRRKLDRTLGGGATSLVFLGVSPEDPQDETQQVAVKVALPEGEMREALETEWHNLKRLERPDWHTHYFPRVLHPDTPDGLLVQIYLRHPSEGWGSYDWAILVQEMVHGDGLRDLSLDFPGGRLPEPLALAVAAQYTEMLSILHDTGLTCADRKLNDLRWETAYELRPPAPEGLARWRNDELPGYLTVLDWNVTEQADAVLRELDIFRFAVLWHRLLLGTEPRFRGGKGQTWQLEEPLDKYPSWHNLSFRTRQILGRLLHPMQQHRYKEARGLLTDLRQHIKAWQQAPERLWSMAQQQQLPPDERWVVMDLLRVLIESWDLGKEGFPDYDRVYRSLERQRHDLPFRAMRLAADRGDWQGVLQEVDRLSKGYGAEPSVLLRLERYGQLAEAARRFPGHQPDPGIRSPQHLDALDGLDEDGLVELRHLKEEHAAKESLWAPFVERLWAEGAYYRALPEARALRESGRVLEARNAFESVMSLRDVLREPGRALNWLDYLYGDPASEAAAVRNALETLQRVADLLLEGLRTITAEGAPLEESRRSLLAALRQLPGHPELGWAYRLLEEEVSWREVAPAASLSLKALRLGDWSKVWQDRPSSLADATSPEGAHPPSDSVTVEGSPLCSDGEAQGSLLASEEGRGVLRQLDHLLAGRRTKLRADILGVVRAPLAARATEPTEKPDQEQERENLRLLVDAYTNAFPGDENLTRQLDAVLLEYRDHVAEVVEYSPARVAEIKERPERLSAALEWARQGAALASVLGRPWSNNLEAEYISSLLQQSREHRQSVRKLVWKYVEG